MYARERVRPSIPDADREKIASYYADLRRESRVGLFISTKQLMCRSLEVSQSQSDIWNRLFVWLNLLHV